MFSGAQTPCSTIACAYSCVLALEPHSPCWPVCVQSWSISPFSSGLALHVLVGITVKCALALISGRWLNLSPRRQDIGVSRGFSARDTSAVHGAPGELCQQSLNALDGLSAGAPGETATHYTLPGSALAFGVSGDAWGGAVLRGSPGLVSRLHAAACTCQVALWPPTCLDGPAALWEQEMVTLPGDSRPLSWTQTPSNGAASWLTGRQGPGCPGCRIAKSSTLAISKLGEGHDS